MDFIAPIRIRLRKTRAAPASPLVFPSLLSLLHACHPPLPAPWTVEETAPCFIVRDHNGQALAFVYCEDEPGRRSTGKLLTRDEARRIAANIAKCRSCCASAERRMRRFLIRLRFGSATITTCQVHCRSSLVGKAIPQPRSG